MLADGEVQSEGTSLRNVGVIVLVVICDTYFSVTCVLSDKSLDIIFLSVFHLNLFSFSLNIVEKDSR
jgi:hypothetical protein